MHRLMEERQDIAVELQELDRCRQAELDNKIGGTCRKGPVPNTIRRLSKRFRWIKTPGSSFHDPYVEPRDRR